MLADRRSACNPWSLPVDEALRLESLRAVPMVMAEGEEGESRFAAGAGRHGEFGRT